MGIVGYELEQHSTGVGRVLAGLLAGALQEAPSWRFVVFSRQRVEHPVLASPRVEVVTREGGPRFQRAVLWEQLELPSQIRGERIDVLYSPSYSLPPRIGVPGVVTVHDLSFERLPEEFGWRERWRRRVLARRACRVAARVLVDAEVIAEELCGRYRIERDRVAVVAPAIDEGFCPAPDDASRGEDAARRSELGVEAPYLLHVGSLLERRRPAALLEALREARSADPAFRLVLAGPDRLRRPAVLDALLDRHGLREAVLQLGWIDDRSLLALYRGATLTLSLSSYEGFCLPPLESLACGTPAVVDSAPGLADLWPDYPFSVRADDTARLSRVVRRALEASRTGGFSASEAIARVRSTSRASAARAWLAELERACA